MILRDIALDLLFQWIKRILKEKQTWFQLELLINNRNPIKLTEVDYNAPEDGKDSTRNVSGKLLNSIANSYPFLIGGSADVSKSTMARITNTTDNSYESPTGRNINFGIREHAMGAIANGMALSHLTPLVSTFFAFSDFIHLLSH